jgi:hypothetical protein
LTYATDQTADLKRVEKLNGILFARMSAMPPPLAGEFGTLLVIAAQRCGGRAPRARSVRRRAAGVGSVGEAHTCMEMGAKMTRSPALVLELDGAPVEETALRLRADAAAVCARCARARACRLVPAAVHRVAAVREGVYAHACYLLACSRAAAGSATPPLRGDGALRRATARADHVARHLASPCMARRAAVVSPRSRGGEAKGDHGQGAQAVKRAAGWRRGCEERSRLPSNQPKTVAAGSEWSRGGGGTATAGRRPSARTACQVLSVGRCEAQSPADWRVLDEIVAAELISG